MAALEEAEPAAGRRSRHGGLGPQITLTVSGVLAGFGLVAALTRLALPATDLPPPFPSQHQDAETLSFLFTFVVALPLALLLVRRFAARIEGARFGMAAAVLAAAASALVIALKLASDLTGVDGAVALLVAAAAWIVLAALLLGPPGGGAGPLLDRIDRHRVAVWAATGGLAVVALLCFVDLSAIAAGPFVALLLLGAVVLYLYGRGTRLPVPSARLGLGLDLVVVLLLLLAVPNLLVFDLGDPFQARIIEFHQGFFLGPANQVLGGGAMLVDTLSQYGVAPIYALVAWFSAVPIGNGTLGLFDNLLSAFVFAGAFATMRLAGVSRLLAAVSMAVAVVALVYGLEYPLGGLLQHGAIRFGMPILVIVAAVAAAARPRVSRPAHVVELLAVGLSSIWAIEALAYTVATFAAIVAVRAVLAPPSDRRRLLGRWIGGALAACVAFHVALAVGTLIAVGELPDWGWYLNTVREFLTGSIGDLTYDFLPWAAALAVGAYYVASAAGVVLLIAERPRWARRNPAVPVALAGTTAWGVALFSYFVNRSADHILPYVCLPVVLTAAIWLGVVLRRGRVALPARLAALAAAGFVACILVATAWPGAGKRFSESALAYAVPGGGTSLRQALDRLWHPPDLSPGASAGADLVERCIPDPDRTYVLTDADLGIEVLARAQRANAFPLGDPWEDSFVPEEHVGRLEDAVSELEPGDRLLIDAPALATFDAYRLDPSRDPLTDPLGEEQIVPTGLAKLQELVLKEIGERFRLDVVCSADGPGGLRAVRLEPRGR